MELCKDEIQKGNQINAMEHEISYFKFRLS